MNRCVQITALLCGLAAMTYFAGCDCGGVILSNCKCAPKNVCVDKGNCAKGMDCVDHCCGGCQQCLEDLDCEVASGQCCREGQCTTKCGQCDQGCDKAEDCAGICMECVNKCCNSFACQTDADCPAEGLNQRFCAKEPDPQLGCRTCQYVRCDTDDNCKDPTNPNYRECEPGQQAKCVRGKCECHQPCGGSCPDGQYCCKQTQLCDIPPVACQDTTCPPCQTVNPNPGGTVNENTCSIDGADCSCVHQPPLPDAFSGQYSAIAVKSDGTAVISGYYGKPYGDLIFGQVGSSRGGDTISWDYVDGVPSGAPCEGDENGPRHGIKEPGDDVGWDTDLVLDGNDRPMISYFDRTNGDLKFARYDGSSWSVHVVDSQGVTGRFTSITRDSLGRPLIAYMTVYNEGQSALKLAWAQNTSPSSGSEWSTKTAESDTGQCEASYCSKTQVCLAGTRRCADADPAASCSSGAGCPAKQACVSGSCVDVITGSSVRDVPVGVGLYASLGIYSDNKPVIAYYDSIRGNLKYVTWNLDSSTFTTPVILDGQDSSGIDTGNKGVGASLIIGADSSHSSDVVHLAYQDATSGDLYYLTFYYTNTSYRVIELVDAGARDTNGNPTTVGNASGDLHWVGNFASIVVDSSKRPRIAYQDGTSLDLVYATRNSAGSWTVEILARKLADYSFDGAYGFFTSQAMNKSGSQAIISNFKINLRSTAQPSRIDLRTK